MAISQTFIFKGKFGSFGMPLFTFFFFLPRVECIQYSLNKKANLALNKHRKQEESASLAPSTGN